MCGGVGGYAHSYNKEVGFGHHSFSMTLKVQFLYSQQMYQHEQIELLSVSMVTISMVIHDYSIFPR